MKVKKAGTILINLLNKKIGLVYREKENDYTFPKGHLEEGETLLECAIRETEEETGRINHLVSEEEISIIKYMTPKGENVENYVYLAIDDGESKKDIPDDLKEELVWVSLEEVENKLSYENLKELWKEVKDKVNEIFISLK